MSQAPRGSRNRWRHELASLTETPENAQRIQELNNALVTLDQRLSSPLHPVSHAG